MTFRILALFLALAAPAAGQYIYGLNVHGKLTVNGTLLDSLPTDFDPDTGQFFTQAWFGLDVSGSNRHALRFDGRLQTNGKKVAQFALGVDTTTGEIYGWRLIDATPNAVYWLRQDGLLVKDETAVVTFPRGDFFFTGLFARDVAITDTYWALRSDGAVFTGTSTAIVAKFTASEVGEPADGTPGATIWVDLAVDPAAGKLYALRVDGELWSVNLADIDAFIASGTGNPPGGSEAAQLPFPAADPSQADAYVALEFSGTTWRALQVRGAVYTSDSVLTPMADYDGNGLGNEDFTALAAVEADTWAIRDDGLVFENTQEHDPILNLVGEDYAALAIGDGVPDLTAFKNPQPKPSPYTVTLREGQPASIPVVVADIEKLPSELVVTTDEKLPLPEGVSYQEVDDGQGGLLRTLEWDGTGPVGSYACRLLVSDGVTKPVKFVTKIKVKPVDLIPEKNKPPVPAKVKKPLALVDHELRLPILADDLDGDALEITVNLDKYPFTAGASFDEATDVFTWTPTFDDIGNRSVKFFVSDGLKTKTRTISIQVKSGLIFDDAP